MEKIMKTSLLTSSLALLALLSSPIRFASPIGAFAIDPEEPLTEKTIYIDLSLSETFSSEAAARYVSFVEDEVEEQLPLISAGNGIYSVNLPLDLVKKADQGFYVSCSIPGEGEDPVEPTIYSTALIKGDSLLKKDNYNYLALAKDGETELASIEGFGYYGTRTANPGATYKTQRVWLAGEEIKDSKRSFGESNAVGYYDAEKQWHVIDMVEAASAANNAIYYYADIPYELVSFDFLRIANRENHNYCVYSDIDVNPISYGGCYILAENKVNTYVAEKADASLLALVIEAYLTYGTAPSNGSVASTVSNLYSTWFDKASADAASLKSVKIMDYTGYTANGNSYEGLEKKSSFTANEKWNTLCSHAGIDPKTGQARSFSPSIGGISKRTLLLVIAGIGGFAVLLAVFAFFMRRYNNAK